MSGGPWFTVGVGVPRAARAVPVAGRMVLVAPSITTGLDDGEPLLLLPLGKVLTVRGNAVGRATAS